MTGPRELEALTRLHPRLDHDRAAAALASGTVRVFLDGHPDYPIDPALPDRPNVLLAEGERPEALDAPRVAVVGTRAATPHGIDDAVAIGVTLARAGVTVVSGMAIGIDGAAHQGALDGGGLVIGVVATGLDVIYPRRHAALFERVRKAGLLMTEYAYGTEPRGGQFPVRNRIIAGLASAVVVVEAAIRGGARITAEIAMDYGIDVFAMPGSRRNRVAEGCNALIADGAHPLLDPTDVLVALGLPGSSDRAWGPPDRPALEGDAALVHHALAGDPATTDQLASRTGLTSAKVAVAVAALERAGWARKSRGMVWPV